jgi:hypothetical protein
VIPRATNHATPRGPFKNLAARTAMDVWRIEYNMVRPHQVLDREVRQANVSEPQTVGGSCEQAVGVQVQGGTCALTTHLLLHGIT